jgi:hypothetical protein
VPNSPTRAALTPFTKPSTTIAELHHLASAITCKQNTSFTTHFHKPVLNHKKTQTTVPILYLPISTITTSNPSSP